MGFCHLTDSHHCHHGQKPTMVGICHGGNMPVGQNINLLRKGTLDKAPFLIISNVIWVLSSDTDPGVELRIWLKQDEEKSLLESRGSA